MRMINAKWQRKILLTVLAYEGWGGITGGALLALAPDGRYMKMPSDLMRGFFPDFFIPGLILIVMGIITSAAFFAVFKRMKVDWTLASLAMYGYIIWFAVEIAVLRTVHWLHIMWGLPVVIGGLIVLPKIPWPNNRK